MHIADMYLHTGKPDRGNRVPDRVAVMGKSARVEHDAVHGVTRRMQLINDCALMIGLENLTLHAKLGGMRQNSLIECLKARVPIHSRLPFPKQIQIRSVHHQ